MPSLYDHEDEIIEYSKINDILGRLSLSTVEISYLRGFFKALEPDGITVKEIIRGLEALKDDMGDEIDSWEVSSLKEEFENLFNE